MSNAEVTDMPSKVNQITEKSKVRSRLLTHAFLIIFGLFMLYPLIWLAVSSLKPSELIFSDTSIIPRHFEWENYTRGWAGVAAPFNVFFKNSMIIATLAVVGNVIACSFVAYAFARLDFAFRKTLFALMLMTIMLPVHASLVPQYILFNSFGWGKHDPADCGAQIPGRGRVFHFPDGAVHSRHPERTRRSGDD